MLLVHAYVLCHVRDGVLMVPSGLDEGVDRLEVQVGIDNGSDIACCLRRKRKYP